MFAANAGRWREVSLQNARKSTRDALLPGLFLMVGRKPRVISPSGCSQRREGNLVTQRRNDRGMNLIGSGTGARRAADGRSPLAAHAGIRLIDVRLDVSEERETKPGFDRASADVISCQPGRYAIKQPLQPETEKKAGVISC